MGICADDQSGLHAGSLVFSSYYAQVGNFICTVAAQSY